MYELLRTWLEGMDLDAKQRIYATLILELATDYERTRNTSTAEAIRKNIGELSRSLEASQVEKDPLTALKEEFANASITRPVY